MVRIGGMRYACRPDATIGQRISNMTLRGKPLDPERRYKVASWAPVAEGATGEPVWNIVVQYLKGHPDAPNACGKSSGIAGGSSPSGSRHLRGTLSWTFTAEIKSPSEEGLFNRRLRLCVEAIAADYA